jgi:hypothetical protein
MCWPTALIFGLALLAGSGCASLNPISVSGGVCGSYYLTNSHTGYLRTANGAIGIFATGKTSMTDTAQMALRIFNLAEENAEVQLQRVTLFRSSLAIPPEGLHFLVAPGQMKKLEMSKSPVTMYAPRWPIQIQIVLGAESFDVDLTLRRQKASSYVEAISIDGKAPESAAAFNLLPTDPPEPQGSTRCD